MPKTNTIKTTRKKTTKTTSSRTTKQRTSKKSVSSVPNKQIYKRTSVDIDNSMRLINSQLVQSKSQLSKTKIKAGMIIRFVYHGKRVHDMNPLILVLNERWFGKLHGIALRYLSVRQVQILSKLVEQTKTQSIMNKLKKIFTFGQRQDQSSIDNPKGFYYSKIKPFIRATHSNVYRTFFVSNISNVQLISFKFQKDIWRQIAIEKQKVASGYTRLTNRQYYKQLSKGDASEKMYIPKEKIVSVDDQIKYLKNKGWA